MSAANALERALHHHRSGQLADAARLYREVLARTPNDANAAFHLGILLMDSGDVKGAASLFARAAAAAPKNAQYPTKLGEAQRRLGHFDLAREAYFKAIVIDPDEVEAVYQLATLLSDQGAVDGAVVCFEHVVERAPELADPFGPTSSGTVRQQLKAARARLASSAASEGTAKDRAGQASPEEALSSSAVVVLASSMFLRGEREKAIHLLDRALSLCPKLPEAHAVRGHALWSLDRFDEAIDAYRRALELDSARTDVYPRLAKALFTTGRLDEAIAANRAARAMSPTDSGIHSDLLFMLHFHREHTARAVLDEARAWDVHARPFAAARKPHSNDRDPERRLRIGYVGSDFRRHCQALYLFPLLSKHDRKNVEVFCYSRGRQTDDWTEGLRGHTQGWRNAFGVDDAAVAAQIREDRIDILVDLTMHMGSRNLPIFARKPAPIQISWLAYPGTTGLSTIDYRITDPFLDPPDSDTTVYTERSLRLPHTFWCYDARAPDVEVSPLPLRANGYVTFGCLNNFSKINEDVLAVWSRVLLALPYSRLILIVPPGEARRRTCAELERHGIEPSRVEFLNFMERADYLATYRRIDVCLDTFPYNGHTTSLDSFWMGVPVVTLVGSTVVGRAGLCLAMNLGLTELIGRTRDEFVQIAVDLCKDHELEALRGGLRPRMEASPLMNAAQFARDLEAAYRDVWREWCKSAKYVPTAPTRKKSGKKR